MWPVGVFDLVQLGLGEGVVEVLDGHLVEGDHVLELGQLGGAGRQTDRPIRQTDRQTLSDCPSSTDTALVATELLPVPQNYFLSRQKSNLYMVPHQE